MTRPFYLLPLAFALGCVSPPAEAPDSIPAPAAAAGRVVGTVRVVGSAPMNVRVVVQPSEGKAVAVTGPLRAELQRLAGAEVAVTGEMGRAPDPLTAGELTASDYEILSVGGEPVVVGEVVAVTPEGAQLRTEAGEVISLTGAPADLRVGQKVWVQGPHNVAVQSYGTIRP